MTQLSLFSSSLSSDFKMFEHTSNGDYYVSRYGDILRVTNEGRIEAVAKNVSDKSKESQYLSTSFGYVHRIVAEAFCENDNLEVKTEVHHIDHISFNNRADNLMWVSPIEHQAITAYDINKEMILNRLNDNFKCSDEFKADLILDICRVCHVQYDDVPKEELFERVVKLGIQETDLYREKIKGYELNIQEKTDLIDALYNEFVGEYFSKNCDEMSALELHEFIHNHKSRITKAYYAVGTIEEAASYLSVTEKEIRSLVRGKHVKKWSKNCLLVDMQSVVDYSSLRRVMREGLL